MTKDHPTPANPQPRKKEVDTAKNAPSLDRDRKDQSPEPAQTITDWAAL